MKFSTKPTDPDQSATPSIEHQRRVLQEMMRESLENLGRYVGNKELYLEENPHMDFSKPWNPHEKK